MMVDYYGSNQSQNMSQNHVKTFPNVLLKTVTHTGDVTGEEGGMRQTTKYCRLKPQYTQNGFINLWFELNGKEKFNDSSKDILIDYVSINF